MLRKDKPSHDETEQEQREREEAAAIFSEAFTGDVAEIGMREREQREQLNAQNQRVPLNEHPMMHQHSMSPMFIHLGEKSLSPHLIKADHQRKLSYEKSTGPF